MQKLLIIDDDLHLRKLVLTYAEMEGYRCEEAENGKQALELFDHMEFDLILLDVMMPGLDGFEVLAEIRKQHQVPVIMLTARDEEYDKLFGFNLGADDYVSKPFSPKELMARVNAVIKRSGGSIKAEERMVYGTLCIEPDAHVVSLNGRPLSLTPKEFDLLLVMAQNERIVLKREQLLEKVWGYEYCGDTRTIDTHVKSLRESLGEYRTLIHTIWGVGYKFEYQEK